MKFLRGVREEGFTLLEVMIVAIIVGILSAVSVPVFKKQIKTSVHITIVADVRNAVSEMEKTETFSKKGYEDKVPDSFIPSDGNEVSIVEDQSSDKFYCLVGTNDTYKDLFVYYHSTTRKLITNGTIDDSNCGDNDSTNGKPEAPHVPDEPVAGETPTYPPLTGGETSTKEPEPETTEPPTTDEPSNPTDPETPVEPENPTPTETPTDPETPPQTGGETSTKDPEPPTTDEPSNPTDPGEEEPNDPGTGTEEELPPPPMPDSFKDPYKGKYEICHNGNLLSLPISAILNGHDGHGNKDIIPPIPGVYPGLNWTQENAELWYSNCGKDKVKIPSPPGWNDKKKKKYEICHNGNMLSLPISAILNGHTGHEDDIVPPIPGHLEDGWNWDEKGSQMWYDDCAGQKENWNS